MKTKHVVTLTSATALAAGLNVQGADATSSVPPGQERGPSAIRAARLAEMSKSEVQRLLAAIESEPPPQPRMGAMCYSMAIAPNRMEYICPACGEKTLHTNNVAGHWTYELETCRRLFKGLPKRQAMTLDESSFCKKCQPGANAPSLHLFIRFNDGTTNKASGITSSDLRLLDGFLSGGLTTKDAQDGERPLKNQLLRLRELLGVTNETTNTRP